jgi:tRNA A37 threonylcarbamoyladenosine synthetase subunit TsaC/SUA5/YrdC
VSSANRTGEPAATTAFEAEAQLGESVAVYLDGDDTVAVSPREHGAPSTIIDATALSREDGKLRIVRQGAISREDIRAVVGDALEDEA